jgi:2-polyprenyl-3-methyl-5-hydroxy-6-metoxy-1,4-benzoquinol methylase
METLESCPGCGNSTFSPVFELKDHSISGEQFVIQVCKHCELLFTNPRPSELEIGPYYNAEQYISHSDGGLGWMSKIYTEVRKITSAQKLALVNKHTSKAAILLDIGSGTGHFVKQALNAGHKAVGVEPSAQARKQALTINQVELKESIEQLNTSQKFDAITLWHVLEHIHDLNGTLEKLQQKLTGHGTLLVAVPNVDAYDADVYGGAWAAWDVPRHLYHFKSGSFKILMERHGFSIIKKQTMPFDPFYVSILSARYAKVKLSLVHALFNGLISFLKGALNPDKGSSIIYVLKKQNSALDAL